MDSKADAIVIDVTQSDCETPLINKAVDAGIKVVTYGGDAPASERSTYYGLDNKAAGAFLMDAVATINGAAGSIAYQTDFIPDGNGGYVLDPSQTFINRNGGFMGELPKYPNMMDVATVPCAGTQDTDPACTLAAEKALGDHPEIKGFVFARSKLLSEANLAANAPLLNARAQQRTIHSVAFDAQSSYFEPMRDGYVDVLLGQKLFGWGYDTVTLAYDLVTINRRVETFTDAGWYTVCPNNLMEFEQNNQAQDYRKPLSKCSLLP